MRLPFMQVVDDKIKRKLFQFAGLNRRDEIQDNELSEGSNLTSEYIPYISPRPSREVLDYTLISPTALFKANKKIAYVDGTDFYFDGVIKGTVTAGSKSMVDFNGHIIIFPDKVYYDYVGDLWGTFTSPDIDFACVHMNRIFGVKGSDIRACKLGDFKSWDTFAGDELDSWAADVASNGDFTGICAYQNHVVMFKDNFMYELYGSYPSQFSIQEVAEIGCIDGKSIAEVNNVLYFLGKLGIYAYTGGLPRPISYNLDEKYLGGSSITDGRRFYISLKRENDHRVYVYDTWNNLWLPEDNLEIVEFINIDNVIYALGADKKIYKFNSGTEKVKWSAITKSYDEQTFSKKSHGKIKVKLELETGSSLNIFTKQDDGGWILEKTISESPMEHRTIRNVMVTLRLKRCDRFQLKFEGVGPCKLITIEREISIGSDKR